MKLKVTGFPGITSKEEIKRVFEQCGSVKKIDKSFGKSIAFVYMSSDFQGAKASRELEGTEILGKKIKIEECI